MTQREGLTHKQFNDVFERIFRKRKAQPPPSTSVDLYMLCEHSIPYHIEGDTVLLSVDGMKRAVEVGAVTKL